MTRRYSKTTPDYSLADMGRAITERLRLQSVAPNLYGYKPHDKQVTFHSAQTFGRLLLGGNRSGKTVGGVVEDLWTATKRHPYRRIPSDIPIRGRAISVNFTDGVEGILLPVFKQWILPSDLQNGSWEDSWNKSEKRLVFADRSSIEFKTYDQDLNKHAGVPLHFVHFDEEPPQVIFNENLLRLTDFNGKYWITMTPVDGMTWVYDTLYEPESGPRKNFTIIQVDMDDNPYLSEEAKANVLEGLSPDEVAARKSGRFMAKGGLVYSEFQETIHATMPAGWLPPHNWTVWMSIDTGMNCPTAIGWHAVSPNKEIVTFHEEYGSDAIVSDWAERIHAYEKSVGLTNRIYLRTGDPAMKQRNIVTGTSVIDEFRNHGVILAVDSVPHDTSIGVNMTKKYFRMNPRTGRPFWQFTTDCRMHIIQFKRLSWETYSSAKIASQTNKKEVIKKLNDHCCDEARYFVTCLPDLTKAELQYDPNPLQEAGKVNMYIDTLIKMSEAPPDAYRPVPRQTFWQTESGLQVVSDGNEWY